MLYTNVSPGSEQAHMHVLSGCDMAAGADCHFWQRLWFHQTHHEAAQKQISALLSQAYVPHLFLTEGASSCTEQIKSCRKSDTGATENSANFKHKTSGADCVSLHYINVATCGTRPKVSWVRSRSEDFCGVVEKKQSLMQLHSSFYKNNTWKMHGIQVLEFCKWRGELVILTC